MPESPGVVLPCDSAPGVCQLDCGDVDIHAFIAVSEQQQQQQKGVSPKVALCFCSVVTCTGRDLSGQSSWLNATLLVLPRGGGGSADCARSGAHEKMAIQMALSEAMHHSAPRGAWHVSNEALRGQKPDRAGDAAGTEF